MLNNFLQISTSETTANHFSLGSLGAEALYISMSVSYTHLTLPTN